MTQPIKIASIEISEGVKKDNSPWKKYTITGEDKTSASTFDGSASSLKVGDTIEAEIELKGKFANIKSFKVIEHGAPSPLTERGEAPLRTGSDRRGESIETQVAVKTIAELRIANALTDKSPEYKAMLAWCRERLNVETKPEPAQQATKSSSSVVAEESKAVAPEEAVKDWTTKKLMALVREVRPALKTDKNVRDWLVASLKIVNERIDSEPEKVWQEVSQLL